VSTNSVLIECRDEHKYNLEAVDGLIRSHLVNMLQYDLHLAQSMENGLNYMAIAFAMQLVQRFCLPEKQTAQITEVGVTVTVEWSVWGVSVGCKCGVWGG